MANSNSDADIKLKATLDSSEVTTGLQKIGQDASTSIDAAAESGSKLGKSLDEVGKSAKVSAQQITSMAVAMSGMAMRLGSSVLESRGMSTGARYLSDAGQMGMQGAAAMAPLGPHAAVVGAIGGAAIGAGKSYFDQQAEAQKKEEAAAELEAANEKAMASFEQLRDAANESADFYAKIGDESVSAEEKQAALSERIRAFGAVAEDIKAKLGSDELQRDGKGFAETMREYAQALKQVDAATAAQRALAKDAAKAGTDGEGRTDTLSDALTRIGGGVAGAGGTNDLASIQREGIGIARDQLGVLREIKGEGLGAWGN